MQEQSEDIVSAFAEARRALILANFSDPAIKYCISGLKRLERHLSRPPRIVVIGEYNSGKTSLANALLGADLLPTGVIANTRVPVTLKYGDVTAVEAVTPDDRLPIDAQSLIDNLRDKELLGIEVIAPNPELKSFEITDTPAFDDAADCLAQADIVIWCTVASQAWAETERRVWGAVPRRYRKRAVLVATNADSLTRAGDADKLLRRLHQQAGHLFTDIKLSSILDPQDATAIQAQLAKRFGIAGVREDVDERIAYFAERRWWTGAKLARRLARLTLQSLVRDLNLSDAGALLDDWKVQCTEYLNAISNPPADAGDAALLQSTEDLLKAFVRCARKVERHVASVDTASVVELPSLVDDPQVQNLLKVIAIPDDGVMKLRRAKELIDDLTAVLCLDIGLADQYPTTSRSDTRVISDSLLALINACIAVPEEPPKPPFDDPARRPDPVGSKVAENNVTSATPSNPPQSIN